MEDTVVAIGTFDGVHLGHQAVLGVARDEGRRSGLEAVAYTFPAPPNRTARPSLLLPPPIKIKLLERYVNRVVTAAFRDVAHLSPSQFTEDVLVRNLRAARVVVGQGFRFGTARLGSTTDLCRLGETHRFAVSLVPNRVVDGEPISSTRIRALLQAGCIEEAHALLGRPPFLIGPVVPGDGIGRSLGFPTANVAIEPDILLPRPGIYFALTYMERQPSYAAVYIGRRPTLRRDRLPMRCEAHLLAPPTVDLVGKTLELHLLRRIRDDRPFEDMSALGAQIREDVEVARRLAGCGYPPIEPIGS